MVPRLVSASRWVEVGVTRSSVSSTSGMGTLWNRVANARPGGFTPDGRIGEEPRESVEGYLEPLDELSALSLAASAATEGGGAWQAEFASRLDRNGVPRNLGVRVKQRGDAREHKGAFSVSESASVSTVNPIPVSEKCTSGTRPKARTIEFEFGRRLGGALYHDPELVFGNRARCHQRAI